MFETIFTSSEFYWVWTQIQNPCIYKTLLNSTTRSKDIIWKLYHVLCNRKRKRGHNCVKNEWDFYSTLLVLRKMLAWWRIFLLNLGFWLISIFFTLCGVPILLTDNCVFHLACFLGSLHWEVNAFSVNCEEENNWLVHSLYLVQKSDKSFNCIIRLLVLLLAVGSILAYDFIANSIINSRLSDILLLNAGHDIYVQHKKIMFSVHLRLASCCLTISVKFICKY